MAGQIEISGGEKGMAAVIFPPCALICEGNGGGGGGGGGRKVGADNLFTLCLLPRSMNLLPTSCKIFFSPLADIGTCGRGRLV